MSDTITANDVQALEMEQVINHDKSDSDLQCFFMIDSDKLLKILEIMDSVLDKSVKNIFTPVGVKFSLTEDTLNVEAYTHKNYTSIKDIKIETEYIKSKLVEFYIGNYQTTIKKKGASRNVRNITVAGISLIINLLKKLPPSKLPIKITETFFTIVFDRIKYQLLLSDDIDNFAPPVKNIISENTMLLSTDEFIASLGGVQYATGTNECQEILTYICAKFNETGITTYGTDGHRMASVKINTQIKIESENDQNTLDSVLINPVIFYTIAKSKESNFLADTTVISIGLSKDSNEKIKWLKIESGLLKIITYFIAEIYPRVEKLIDDYPQTSVATSLNILTLRNFLEIALNNSNNVLMFFGGVGGKCGIISRSADSDNEYTLPSIMMSVWDEVKTNAQKICFFNIYYLLEAIKSFQKIKIKDLSIRFTIHNNIPDNILQTAPIVIEVSDNSEKLNNFQYQAFLMPIQMRDGNIENLVEKYKIPGFQVASAQPSAFDENEQPTADETSKTGDNKEDEIIPEPPQETPPQEIPLADVDIENLDFNALDIDQLRKICEHCNISFRKNHNSKTLISMIKKS